MADLLSVAAMNNVLQSEAVLAALGSAGSFTDAFWSNGHSFDIPYANGATLGGEAKKVQHLQAIEELTASRTDLPATHIMDSRATLDLVPLGYEVRLADEWFVRDGGNETDAAPPPVLIEIVSSAAGMAEFEAASVAGFGGDPPEVPGHTYPASLLSDERFTMFCTRVDGEIASGVFLFRDPECTGVFTFFTLPSHRGQGLGSAVLRHALSHAPDLPLATNPSSMSRGIFERLGFRAIGERRIWVTEKH